MHSPAAALPKLNLDLCRARQRRLREALAAGGIDQAVLVKPEHVQYLTGFRPHPLHAAALALTPDSCLLAAPNSEPPRHAADRVATFEAQWLCTLRQDQEQAAAAALADLWAGRNPRAVTAVEHTRSSPALLRVLDLAAADIPDAEPALLDCRRKKDPDELAMIRHAIGATAAMYARAREIIRPGIDELDVFNELQSAAVTALGEPWTATGNDYQCGSPGGPPRAGRKALAGELFILDLGPAYRGYFADNCRAIAVDREPDDRQLEAWRVIMDVLAEVEAGVRPGVRCRDVFERAKALLDRWMPGSFSHHLGHGIGLYPHETPHLNSAWDDVFQEGDVFTAEPGLYHESLRAGIRIEQNYLVTASGVELLTAFSAELA
jgi:Xaa-Pro dipeptidase